MEIGSNTVVDRGSWRDTVIDKGAMIDTLVHVGKRYFGFLGPMLIAGQSAWGRYASCLSFTFYSEPGQ